MEILHCHETPKVFLNKLKEDIIACKISDDFIPEINLICKYENLFLNSFEIAKVEIDLEKNYNDDFIEIDQIIKERLNKPKGKGIVLLHGIPGTGKTNYVRHLLSTVKKKMIYLPPDLAHEIGNPGFLTFLTDHADAILIIEDAETVVMERSPGSQGAISNLLNLCDGLLSDCLNIQVVCSFNTDISKIDAALLRKGRLIAKYEFKHLLTEKARVLSAHLGFTNSITTAMTLSEIYNQDEKAFEGNTVKKIGFGINKVLA